MISDFSEVMYFDEDKFTQYYSVISDEGNIDWKTIQKTKGSNMGTGTKLINANKGSTYTYEGELKKSILKLAQKFEEAINSNDYFVDFSEMSDRDPNYLTKDMIIKFESDLLLPKEFESILLLSDTREYGEKKLVEDFDDESLKMFGHMLKIKEPKTPYTFEIKDRIGVLKLEEKNYIHKEEFEEFEDDNFTIIGKVINPKNNQKKEYFDPMKDFFQMSRAVRRMIITENNNEYPEGLRKLYMNEDYLMLQPIIILH
ncbi:DUF6414 family protein [Carnobacterium mobile]|uniref:DUF6414 family protein n=1 Tax=Carnobacterium mobile TaxID=2750 RepID=UPI001868AEBA|nr:hypothetical protein [Carnobacterium mobile]